MVMPKYVVVECEKPSCDVIVFRGVRNEPAADYCPNCGILGAEVMPEVLDLLDTKKTKE